jgi:alkanesulfonate monooxygenase SsuD/methylene tetrahydromethanopterin reductase-like flavin-dependent oxidoreductase (luciferase family)
MAVLGAATKDIRLSWTVLNLAPHNPAVLAKMLASLDRLTGGRVIASVGSGWYYEELTAYNLPLIEEHDERSLYAREVIELFRRLRSTPAPETVSYEGKFVQVRDVAFNPAPFQKPMPPIWMGGDSPATLGIVSDLAGGWIPWSTFTCEHFARHLPGRSARSPFRGARRSSWRQRARRH